MGKTNSVEGQKHTHREGRSLNNGKMKDDSFLTNNNMWFFSQHQRLRHHIDSSHYNSCTSNETRVRIRTIKVFCVTANCNNFHIPHLTPMLEPRASNCSEIWKANSLVGVRTRVWSRWGEASSDWRMGRAKAPVFPEPVSARPITSLPKVQEGTGGNWWGYVYWTDRGSNYIHSSIYTHLSILIHIQIYMAI